MNLKYKIGIVEYDFDKIIDEWIEINSRKEAKIIISELLSNPEKNIKDIFELIIYVEKELGNIICLHISKIKQDLIEQGIKIPGDKFKLE